MAHIWNTVEPILPTEVRADYETVRLELGGLSMDGGTRNEDEILSYTINGKEFATINKAPAAGVVALNYCN